MSCFIRRRNKNNISVSPQTIPAPNIQRGQNVSVAPIQSYSAEPRDFGVPMDFVSRIGIDRV